MDSRGTTCARMAARFLGVSLKAKGLEEFAAELDRRLAQKHGSIDIYGCKFLIDQNPQWLAGPFAATLPGSTAKSKRRQFRRAAA